MTLSNSFRLYAIVSKLFFAGFFPIFNVQANEPLNIAVASNFASTMKHIATEYEHKTGNIVNILSGATGKHHLQIVYGAPIDIFFAADEKRPHDLVIKGKAKESFTYAIGQLVYWNPNYTGDTISFQNALILPTKNISIAHPHHAPYGTAAKETLQKLQQWNKHNNDGKVIYAENSNQSYAMIKSRAVTAGFVAYSHILQHHNKNNYWLIPNKFHNPIRQNAVVIKPSQETKNFLTFFNSERAQEIIKEAGYQLP